MKKGLLLGICIVSFAASVQAFELSKPSLNTIKQIAQPQTTQTTQEQTIDTTGTIGHINSRLLSINAQVQTAYESLFSALLSKEDYNKYKAELDAIQNDPNLSESEKSAKLMQVATDTSAILANQEKQDEISANLKSLSDAKKTEYVNAVSNLTNATAEYLVLAKECKTLSMRIASNPVQAASLALELGKLKDTSALLVTNIKSIKNVTTQVIAINKANGIEVSLPESSSDKAKKVDF